MEITREMFLNLPCEQTLILHERVAVYLDSHYDTVIDAGLIDDVLFTEYKSGLTKLYNKTALDEEEGKKLEAWLCTLVWQMVECSASNLTVGRNASVYADFIRIIKTQMEI